MFLLLNFDYMYVTVAVAADDEPSHHSSGSHGSTRHHSQSSHKSGAHSAPSYHHGPTKLYGPGHGVTYPGRSYGPIAGYGAPGTFPGHGGPRKFAPNIPANNMVSYPTFGPLLPGYFYGQKQVYNTGYRNAPVFYGPGPHHGGPHSYNGPHSYGPHPQAYGKCLCTGDNLSFDTGSSIVQLQYYNRVDCIELTVHYI